MRERGARLRSRCARAAVGWSRYGARTNAAARFAVHAALAIRSGLLWLTCPLSGQRPEYPDLSDMFPAANRMQRATYDLLGVGAAAPDRRPWLRHGAWPPGEFPLRRSFDPSSRFASAPDEYAFVSVQGEGVHEIPVGPVHAGIIEPGHFRFSVVGERVLRLEERLGYVHKGIEKRFESLGIHDGYRLAGRISGDSTVAYAWAYAMAAESAAGRTAPPRANWLRALLLERERIANHLGDLGFLGNDAGLAMGLAQFSRLKEECLRTNERVLRPPLCDGPRHSRRSSTRLVGVRRKPHGGRDRSHGRGGARDERDFRGPRRVAGSPHRRRASGACPGRSIGIDGACRPCQRHGLGSACPGAKRALRRVGSAHGDASQRRCGGAGKRALR